MIHFITRVFNLLWFKKDCPGNRTSLFRSAIWCSFFLLHAFAAGAQKQSAIYSGTPWFDDKGKVVSAHGGCIVKDKSKYYFFGERHTDTSNAFAGFNCYSSPDLYNWKFERIALPVQATGKLGPQRVGERVKVMQCPATGTYVMFMHVDTLGYKDQFVGYATAANITGPYTFKGPLLFNGSPIKKWDMGTFQDRDGSGYILIHGGEIYKLSTDYSSVTEQVNKNMTAGFESPAIFRKGSCYYFLGAHLTSWERNDNYYYTATSLKGPWQYQGLFAPEGTLTWNSQTSFVFPVEGTKDTTWLFMGDRWAFPKQASAATYVWQPITVTDTSITIAKFYDAWQVNTITGEATPATTGKKNIESTDSAGIKYTGLWNHVNQAGISQSSTDESAASCTMAFTGTQTGFYSLATPDGGYAQVTLKNSKGKVLLTAVVDMYCKYATTTLKFISPVVAKGNYTLTVTAMGERGNWSDKRKSVYGSTGNRISIDRFFVND